MDDINKVMGENGDLIEIDPETGEPADDEN